MPILRVFPLKYCLEHVLLAGISMIRIILRYVASLLKKVLIYKYFNGLPMYLEIELGPPPNPLLPYQIITPFQTRNAIKAN